MSLPGIAIRRPVFAWMIMGALIIFGLISASRMGISQLPDVDFPVVSISVSYPGAAPAIIESNVVDVLEDAVMTIEGVRSVSSTTSYGQARITVEFDLSRNIAQAFQDVQNKVTAAQRQLPKDMDPPILRKTNPEDQPIMWLTLSSDKYTTPEIMRYVKDVLRDKLSSISGVGDVLLGGYVDPNLRVWVSRKKLEKYQLSATDVVDAIQAEHSELPAGQITTGPKEYDVRTMGEATTPKEFENLVISHRGGQPVYRLIRLKQVATVEDGLADIQRISRTNGLPAVGLGIQKQRGSNAVAVAHRVKKEVALIQKQLPAGMKLSINFDTTHFIEQSVGEFYFTLVLSALATALVCWLFLGSWTATLNVILAIPTSIIGTFIALYFFGFTLNTFTLLGLSLAIGIVVDDAIMVLENIVRHREQGEGRVEAAYNGARQIQFAALAATLAVIAIFLPVAFMRGAIGRFFFQFGVTMTVAVLLSLFEALTLTPMRTSQFVQAGTRTTRIGRAADFFFHRVAALYGRILHTSLRHPWIVLLISLAFFAASMMSLKPLHKEFVPAQDQSMFLVRMKTPVDSSLQYTDSKFKQAEAWLRTRPEVLRYFTAVGGFGAGGIPNTGILFVTLKPKGQRGIDPKFGHELSQQEMMDVTRKALHKIPDVKVQIQDLSLRGFSATRGFPVEFAIQGPDWNKLAQYSKEIMKKLNATGLVDDVDTDYLEGKPEIQVIPDRAAAAARGVSIQSISEVVNILVGGYVAGQYSSHGHRYDIRVQLQEKERDRANQIKHLFVRNNRGELVPLSDVVRLKVVPTLAQINRYDRERAIQIFANIKTGKSQQAALDAARKITKEVLPGGYFARFVGGSQSFRESFHDLLFALVLGLLVSYMVLASQFNSFIHPVSVLMALPFSVSGAFLTLLITGQSLNIYSFIGLILLMGIVKKNSILLVDFTNQVRAAGETDIRKALQEACPVRLRPILMTSFATIAAALPLALAIGPGAETRVPMAMAIIGGVIVSTMLTLFVVPAVYQLLSFFERRTVQPPLTGVLAEPETSIIG